MIRTVGDLIAALQEYPEGMMVLTPGFDESDPCLVEMERETVYTGPKDAERRVEVLILTFGDQPKIPNEG